MVSKQVSLESFAEPVERLCGPDVGSELIPPIMPAHRATSATRQDLSQQHRGVCLVSNYFVL